jgi:hypothetical protein
MHSRVIAYCLETGPAWFLASFGLSDAPKVAGLRHTRNSEPKGEEYGSGKDDGSGEDSSEEIAVVNDHG